MCVRYGSAHRPGAQKQESQPRSRCTCNHFFEGNPKIIVLLTICTRELSMPPSRSLSIREVCKYTQFVPFNVRPFPSPSHPREAPHDKHGLHPLHPAPYGGRAGRVKEGGSADGSISLPNPPSFWSSCQSKLFIHLLIFTQYIFPAKHHSLYWQHVRVVYIRPAYTAQDRQFCRLYLSLL